MASTHEPSRWVQTLVRVAGWLLVSMIRRYNLWGLLTKWRFGYISQQQETQLALTNSATHLCKWNDVADLTSAVKIRLKNLKFWFLASSLSRSLKVIGTDTDRSAIYDFLLVFYSNFVPKTHRFWDIRLQIAVTLKSGLGFPSTSLNMSPFDRAHDFLLTFYSNYGSISCCFWDIQCRKMSWPWNPSQRSLKVIECGTIR